MSLFFFSCFLSGWYHTTEEVTLQTFTAFLSRTWFPMLLHVNIIQGQVQGKAAAWLEEVALLLPSPQ